MAENRLRGARLSPLRDAFQVRRVPYTWLAEWVSVPWQGAELGSRLTMAGFELEALETAAPAFTGVDRGRSYLGGARSSSAGRTNSQVCQVVNTGRAVKPCRSSAAQRMRAPV